MYWLEGLDEGRHRSLEKVTRNGEIDNSGADAGTGACAMQHRRGAARPAVTNLGRWTEEQRSTTFALLAHTGCCPHQTGAVRGAGGQGRGEHRRLAAAGAR